MVGVSTNVAFCLLVPMLIGSIGSDVYVKLRSVDQAGNAQI
jgi:hypothetical protein